MVRIVIDGAGDMPEEWREQYDLHMIPLRVVFGEKSFIQGPDFTNEDFYRTVNELRIIPKSSLPSIGQVKEFYRSIAQKGDSIISIHVSGKLSGTVATVEAAARELVDELDIHVFDSAAGSMAQGFLAREARILERAGATIPQILHRLEYIRRNWTVIFTLDNLEYAKMSGRVTAIQSIFASTLQVKPIIVLREGLLDMADRVRTRSKALDRVLQTVKNRVGDRLINMAIVHAADPVCAQDMVERSRSIFNVGVLCLAELSVPVAANLGPGAIGVVAYPVEGE